jgi:DNA-binding winged helix-turn-helix (wHTH) protein
MISTRSSPRALRFGVYEADLTSGELRKRGVKIKLHGQPFQVLVLLLQRPGEVITREEISDTLWGDDTFVDIEHGVATAISKIRDALDDSADSPRYVETLPRRGYRFIAQVEPVIAETAEFASTNRESPPKAESEIHATKAVSKPPISHFKRGAILAGLVVLMLVSVTGLSLFNYRIRQRATEAPVTSVRSIAVLPFESLSGRRISLQMA